MEITPTQNHLKITKKSQSYFSREDIHIYNDDFLKMSSIPQSSVDLIITSPPYNIDIDYNSHKDDISYKEYLQFSERWIQKCYDLAKDDGRFCLNIP